MCCPTCGDVLQGRTYDYGVCRETGYRDAGEYDYCDTCRKAVDEGDSLDERNPKQAMEAEALREAHEEQISQRQYDAWIDEAEGAGGAA